MERLSKVLLVSDGKNAHELRTFDDVRDFLRPRGDVAPIGIARVLCLARTTEQKTIALDAFVEWARKTGLLIETQPA